MATLWCMIAALLLSPIVRSVPLTLDVPDDVQLLKDEGNANLEESDDVAIREKKSYSGSIGSTVCVQVDDGYGGPVTICKEEPSYGAGYSNHAGPYGAGHLNQAGFNSAGYSNHGGPYGYSGHVGPYGGGYTNHIGSYGAGLSNHAGSYGAGYLNNAGYLSSIDYGKGPLIGYGHGHGAGVSSSSYGPLSPGLLSGSNSAFLGHQSDYSKPLGFHGAYLGSHGSSYIGPHSAPHYRSMEDNNGIIGGGPRWSALEEARSAYEPYGNKGYSDHGLHASYGKPYGGTVFGGINHGFGGYGAPYHSSCPHSLPHQIYEPNLYKPHGYGPQHYRTLDETKNNAEQPRKQIFDEMKTQELPKSMDKPSSAEVNMTNKDDDNKQRSP